MPSACTTTLYFTRQPGTSQNTGLYSPPVYTPDSLVPGQTLMLGTDGQREHWSLSGLLSFSWRWDFEERLVQRVDGERLLC